MIRMISAATTTAILLALLSISCSKTKAPPIPRNGSHTITRADLQSPSPQMLQPPIPSTVISPASPGVESVLEFSGEISRGQRFEKVVAPGMLFRLEPYAGNDSGWDIRLAPDTEPSPASVDCIGAVSIPSHGSNDLSIELSEEQTAQGVMLRNPHEFDFVPNPSDCKRAWDLNNSIAYRYNQTDQERRELDGKLSEIPNGHGQLKVLDFRLSPQAEPDKPGAIDWIKFEVDLKFPQPDNPALAKARASSGPLQARSPQAEREIPYSPPSAFAQLPPKIQSELQSRGCRIPQTYVGSALQNLIQGQFARRGQTDLAVLCSKENISSILIFWDGSETAPAEIDPAPDRNFLTPLENGKIGYSRAISRVGKEFILAHYRAYGGPKPPPIDHDGINDEFLEKGSTVHYFYLGQWLHLTGSD
jgi:hypothetical protein